MGIDPFAAEGVKAGVSPAFRHPDEFPGDFPFTKEHGEDFVAEELLQISEVESGSDPEPALPVEPAIRRQDMQVGMKAVRIISKGLCGYDRPWGSLGCGHCGFKTRMAIC